MNMEADVLPGVFVRRRVLAGRTFEKTFREERKKYPSENNGEGRVGLACPNVDNLDLLTICSCF